MKTLIFVLIFFLVLVSPQYSQTQLLKVGNAAQFVDDTDYPRLKCIIKNKNINGNQYCVVKNNYAPWSKWNTPFISHERIDGDSIHYILSSTNSDSLVFNFNRQVGDILKRDSSRNFIYLEILDSIKNETTFTFTDTLYFVGHKAINITTGDTIPNWPLDFTVSKKFGRLTLNFWIWMVGVKVNGIRYGEVDPFPEEVVFSADSIYVPTLSDSGSVQIINTSDYAVKVDSIISVGSFYGYWGEFSKPGFLFPFYLIQTFPNQQWGDTLGIIIPPHDSINVSFYNVDLCPICDYEVQEYFNDTLRFVFTFLDGNVYSFSKSIPISGEGHPSDVESEEVLPNKFILEQNYPNPFNPTTIIQYAISSRLFVTLKVYDVLGNEVTTLFDEYKNAGNYNVEFRMQNLELSSGVYFYQLKAGDFIQTKKMIYLK